MKLELKMDNKTFWFCIVIIFLLGLTILSWNDTPIVVERYNCSCPEEPSIYKNIDWKWEKFETNQSEIDTFNFSNCHQIPCPENRSGCLVYHMECS